VLKLLALGHSANSISKSLFISEWTVKDHRKHILEKLRAKNTCNAIYIACKNKLLIL